MKIKSAKKILKKFNNLVEQEISKKNLIDKAERECANLNSKLEATYISHQYFINEKKKLESQIKKVAEKATKLDDLLKDLESRYNKKRQKIDRMKKEFVDITSRKCALESDVDEAIKITKDIEYDDTKTDGKTKNDELSTLVDSLVVSRIKDGK